MRSLFCLCVLLVCSSASVVGNDEELMGKLKSEGSKGWAFLEEQCFANRHCIWTEENDQNKDKKEVFRYEFSTDSGLFLLKKLRIDDSAGVDVGFPETIVCLNGKYGFSILKGQQEQDWRVLFCESRKNVASRVTQDEEETTISVVKSSFAIFGRSLGDLLQDDGFVITNISEENVDGYNMVLFDFSFQPIKGTQKGMFENIKKGKVYVMPDNHWAISKVLLDLEREESSGSNKFQNSIVVSYANNVSGSDCPQMSRVVFSLIRQSGATISWVSDFEKFEVSNLNKNELLLSHYGIPEPDFGERPIGWFRFTMMATGVILIGFALWRMYWTHEGNKS